jgi:hypothetical protein
VRKRDEDLQRYGIMRRKEAALHDARNRENVRHALTSMIPGI